MASHAPTDGAAVRLDRLTKRFGSFVALDALSLSVDRGEVFGLVGPNGSGKTTTINMISGLARPTSGSAHVLGFDITRDSRAVHAVLGAVPQETALYEELSAWANMVFHAELYNVARDSRDRRIDALLALVGLTDRKSSRVGTFSGGMKRRLALARALLHDPQLLYLDEPTLGVDVQSRRALWDYILDLKRQGKTVLLTTNYLEEANTLCDRLAVLDRGKLVALDTPARLKQLYGDTVLDIELNRAPSAAEITQVRALDGVRDVVVEGARLRVTAGGASAVTAQVISLLAGELAYQVRAIAQREPNLDEIFLSLTGSALRD